MSEIPEDVMERAQEWTGPFKGDAAGALDSLRRSVAELIGENPDTWPTHKNAPLAIAAAVAILVRDAQAYAIPTASAGPAAVQAPTPAGVSDTMTEARDYIIGLGQAAEAEGWPRDQYAVVAKIEAALRSQPPALKEPSAGVSEAVDTRISLETQAQLDAIDENIRSAAISASTTFVGATLSAPPVAGTGEATPLRYCDYCKTWNSKPCGEQCVWTPSMPTSLATPKAPSAVTEAMVRDAVGTFNYEMGYAYHEGQLAAMRIALQAALEAQT